MSVARSELLRLPLRCDRLAPARARSAIADLDEIEPFREDAMLLASELVSSAVLEIDCADPEDTIEFVACEAPRGVCLEVAAAEARRPHPGALVAKVLGAISARWGVECRDGHARLWAELTI